MLVKKRLVVLLSLMVVSLVLASVMFQFASVLAQSGSTDTPTPLGSSTVVAHTTATYVSATPGFTPTGVSFVCPLTTPVGWGTYTPSPLWMIECAGCGATLTSTVTAVPTWSGTGTPPSPTSTSISTPTPYVTPDGCVLPVATFLSTIEPGSSFINCYIQSGGTCTLISPTVYRFVYSGDANEMDWGFEFVPASVPVQVTVDGQVSLAETYGDPQNPVNRAEGDFHINVFGNTMSQYDVTDWCYGPIAYQSMCANSIHRTYTMVGPGWPYGGFSFKQSWYPDWPSEDVMNYDFLVTLGAVCAQYGTPMPPGTPVVSYCASVSPLDSGFGWDVFVDDGAKNCDMGWSEFSIGDYDIPAVQICLQPVQFGVIKLFGNSYEVGVFGLVVMAAFFWRFWRTI